MAQDATGGQGFHAALIPAGAIRSRLKHFPDRGREMLQEIRAACVDLGRNRP